MDSLDENHLNTIPVFNSERVSDGNDIYQSDAVDGPQMGSLPEFSQEEYSELMRELNNDDNGDNTDKLDLDRNESIKRFSNSNQLESFHPISEAVNLQACQESTTNQSDIVFENRTVGTNVTDQVTNVTDPDSLDLDIFDQVRPAVARILPRKRRASSPLESPKVSRPKVLRRVPLDSRFVSVTDSEGNRGYLRVFASSPVCIDYSAVHGSLGLHC